MERASLLCVPDTVLRTAVHTQSKTHEKDEGRTTGQLQRELGRTGAHEEEQRPKIQGLI